MEGRVCCGCCHICWLRSCAAVSAAERLPLGNCASLPPLLSAPPACPQVNVLAKIGEGAFGEVSLAQCATFGRVAVKWIKPTKVERHWSSFWHEAELMSRLNHPNVLRFFGLVVEGPMVVGIMTGEAVLPGCWGVLPLGPLPALLPLHFWCWRCYHC